MFNLISNKMATKEVETAGSIAYKPSNDNSSSCAYTGSFNAGSSSSSSGSSFSAMA